MRRGFATFGGNLGLVFTSEDDLGLLWRFFFSWS